MFELIKKYYRMGIYSDADVDMFARCKEITDTQAAEIKATRG